mmetsp:Transcript_59592/g.94276  ORF Transcript_59592/g.94276 Transcript_59592/m.94276 type:complete len:220 (-) Transcript_59592:105-764(-)
MLLMTASAFWSGFLEGLIVCCFDLTVLHAGLSGVLGTDITVEHALGHAAEIWHLLLHRTKAVALVQWMICSRSTMLQGQHGQGRPIWPGCRRRERSFQIDLYLGRCLGTLHWLIFPSLNLGLHGNLWVSLPGFTFCFLLPNVSLKLVISGWPERNNWILTGRMNLAVTIQQLRQLVGSISRPCRTATEDFGPDRGSVALRVESVWQGFQARFEEGHCCD